ncbi:hypothetical protein [Agarivorans sp. DSG3-1]|uniref:hypothetical protein n=1 Tax=Agarivorans sp. DSG3-1 TaxID=3342249 RepID=UPI00398F4A77
MLFKQEQFKATVSLLLLAVMLSVCVAKNIGLKVTCPQAHVASEELAGGLITNEGCQLSEHVLQQQQQNVEQVFVVVLFLAFATLAAQSAGYTLPFAKPTIPPPRRLYCSQCHFRE